MMTVIHTDPVTPVVFWVTVLFFIGMMGRYLAQCFHQPGVLGELVFGVLFGNICYFFGVPLITLLREGPDIFNIMREVLDNLPLPQAVQTVLTDPKVAPKVLHILMLPNGVELLKVVNVVDILSRYGVIFLLFMVGLDTSLEELKHTGRASLRVAMIGVIAPIFLGLGLMHFLMPDASFKARLFIAATLTATSVGITARVLHDLKKTRTREAKTILGAAMIDDILGLVLLSIVSSIATQGVINGYVVLRIIIFATLFFAGTLMLGPWILRKTVAFFGFLDVWEAKLATAFLCVMALAWLASLVQLSSIIGAFAAGIIIHDGFFAAREDKSKPMQSIRNLIAPLEAILAPLFFVLIGLQVKLELFTNIRVLVVASGLIVVAILGKLLSGFGAARGTDRWLVGIGMMPRGEVGLVFASIGKTLGLISAQVFSAIILMVMVTTFIAPPWLKARYHKRGVISE